MCQLAALARQARSGVLTREPQVGWMMSNIVRWGVGFSAEASKDYVASYEALATRKKDDRAHGMTVVSNQLVEP